MKDLEHDVSQNNSCNGTDANAHGSRTQTSGTSGFVLSAFGVRKYVPTRCIFVMVCVGLCFERSDSVAI